MTASIESTSVIRARHELNELAKGATTSSLLSASLSLLVRLRTMRDV